MNYIKFFKWIFVIIAIAIICYTIFLILATIGIFYVGYNFTNGQARALYIPTKLAKKACASITDSLMQTDWPHNVPDEWNEKIKYLISTHQIPPTSKNGFIFYYYFPKDSLETNKQEMIYVIAWGQLNECYEKKILKLVFQDKTISPNLLPTEQKEEILERFENEILNTIEREAKRQGWADDSLYCTKYEY